MRTEVRSPGMDGEILVSCIRNNPGKTAKIILSTLLLCWTQQQAHTSSCPLFFTLPCLPFVFALVGNKSEEKSQYHSRYFYAPIFSIGNFKASNKVYILVIFSALCASFLTRNNVFLRWHIFQFGRKDAPVFSVYIAPPLWTNNATVIVKMDTWGGIHSTYWARNFSQKLFLFCLSSTEVDSVLDRECSRMSRSLAVCTRVSAVCGHTQMFSPG